MMQDRLPGVSFRVDVCAGDPEQVRSLVSATGFFTGEEIAIAGELVEERLAKGPGSGYEFIMAEAAGTLAGYTCFGRIAGSDWSFDLYWIAVAKERRRSGLGTTLLARTERALASLGCRQLYADTSSTDLYAPTRDFYSSAGFAEVARLPDFYRRGDSKVIYRKVIGAALAEGARID